ncbi:MAG: hypothetical protein K2I30_05440 [Clostridia bacterium]|nr:hypothetical protein [Clostridia bacterium]
MKKYLNKIIALVIGIAFVAAVIISLGKIFAIKNVNVTMLTYSDDCTESYNEAKDSFKKFKGESLLLVKSSDFVNAVSDSNYTVVSCEKKYPCTVNVVLKERLETFAVFVGGQYSMYDADGKFLRKCVENVNINDGSPNVELVGVAVEELGDIAKISSLFKDNFKALRSVVSSITLDANSNIADYTEKLVFNLRCGLKIEIDNFNLYTEEKLEAAYAKFVTLTDREKLGGTVRSYHRVDGEVNVVYTANVY